MHSSMWKLLTAAGIIGIGTFVVLEVQNRLPVASQASDSAEAATSIGAIPSVDTDVIPDATVDFARKAAGRGLRVIIAAAGGAAHLAGVVAAYTWLPVLGVPMQSQALHGLDSLLSIAQMPGGIPVGTLAIGTAGAKNAAILAASIIGLSDEKVRKNLEAFRKKQTDAVLAQRVPK